MNAFRLMLAVVMATAMASMLAACSSKPPGCADGETKQTARSLILDAAVKTMEAEATDDPDGLIKQFVDGVKFELASIVDEGYRSEAKKQSCKGNIRVTMLDGKGFEGQVDYTTQRTVDDKSSFLLEMENAEAFSSRLGIAGRQYYRGNRWVGDWNGTYSCAGIDGAMEGPQGPFSNPVTMVVTPQNDGEYPPATLERTTLGGGVEKLEGGARGDFDLKGRGANSSDDRWSTMFKIVTQGERATGDGEIRNQDGHLLRKCKLDLTRGGPLPAQTQLQSQTLAEPATSAAPVAEAPASATEAAETLRAPPSP